MNVQRQTAVTPASSRKTAMAAGVLYLITHVTSVGAVALYGPILNDAASVTGSGSETQVLLGALFEVILALAIIGTGVALYPVARRQNEGVALGYVGLRALEAAVIAVGVVPLLTLVTLRQHLTVTGIPAGETAAFAALGSSLVAFHNWTFLVGPGLICGANTVVMAYLLYQSRLVPRFIPTLGLIGGALVFASSVAQMFGIIDQVSVWAGVPALVTFAWELSLAIRLIVRGFKTPAPASESAVRTTGELLSAA